MTAVITSVSKMLEVKEYLQASTSPMQSFKNALQEWCADKKHRREVPVYKTISETGPDHKKIYERACYIGSKVYGVGQGKNQKLADSAAAEEALKALIAEHEKEIMFAAREKASEAVQKLKDYATKNKKTSPEFRDLGEASDSTDAQKKYEIECRFAGMSAKASASDKRDAKALAAEKLLNMLMPVKNPQKATKKAIPVSKKPIATGKKPTQSTRRKATLKKNTAKNKTN